MAKLDINVVTSLVGKGLEREYLLLKDLLNAHDVYTNAYHYTNLSGSNFVRADVTVFLEVVMPPALHLAKENWLFPNCEWWNPVNDRFLPMMTKICCKTRDCERIWREKLSGRPAVMSGDQWLPAVSGDRPERVVYTGFESRDLYDASVPRERRFLHVAGESEFKNTEAVIEAWRTPRWDSPVPASPPPAGAARQMSLPTVDRPPLTVVTRQKAYQQLCEGIPGVTCLERVTDDELKVLMNSHQFHLMPSAYEGFGHALHESLLCGAVVVTTDAPPMREFLGVRPECLVPVMSRSPRSLAQLCKVSAKGIVEACCRAVLSGRMVDEDARAAALKERDEFRQWILQMLGVV